MKRRRRRRRGPQPRKEITITNLRVVELLDSLAGNRGTSKGEPLLMVTVAHQDTVETIGFNLQDTKRLVMHALAMLAAFEVPLAKEILDTHFNGEDDSADRDVG